MFVLAHTPCIWALHLFCTWESVLAQEHAWEVLSVCAYLKKYNILPPKSMMFVVHNINKQNKELYQTTCEIFFNNWKYYLTMNQQPRNCFCKRRVILANCDLIVYLGVSPRNAMTRVCCYLQNMFLPIILQPQGGRGERRMIAVLYPSKLVLPIIQLLIQTI